MLNDHDSQPDHDQDHAEAPARAGASGGGGSPGKVTRTGRLAAPARADASPGGGSAAWAHPTPGDEPFGLHVVDAVQRRGGGTGAGPGEVRAAAAHGLGGGGGALPFASQIQASFGAAADVSQITAHVGGVAAEACDTIGATAYASGNQVAFAGSPDLHTAAHEAAHVVQQARGVNLYGGVGVAGDAYERHADEVADRVVAGRSAEDLLADRPSGGGHRAADDEHGDEPDDGPAVQRKASGLGAKENLLAQWKREMVEVAHQLAGEFTPLGLHFRPQILLATAMQEAAARDPLHAVSFDNGLGIMQITPYRGKLDPQVARAIGWDNSRSVSDNMRNSNWRSAKANLLAGGYTMLSKAKAIKRMVPSVWGQMDEPHKWRAVLFAYNAGEGSAVSALRRGGPNAAMISTFTDKRGRRVSHDYTAEISEKMDYVDRHDPFGGAGHADAPPAQQGSGDHADAPPAQQASGDRADAPPAQQGSGDQGSGGRRLSGSVGRGGRNRRRDVNAVQQHLHQHGFAAVGRVDSLVGPKTIRAIEAFQRVVLGMVDGLIQPGKNTERHLFGAERHRPPAGDEHAPTPPAHAGHGDRPGQAPATPGGDHEATHGAAPAAAGHDAEHPSWAAISRNFGGRIGGSRFTWHEALWLPSFGRHVQPSDVTNISIDTLIANVERQAQALSAVANALGKSIVVHCWVRPPAYNRRIGGAGNSAHLRGMATDFHCPGMSAEQVRRAVKSQHLYPGAGENNVSWVHLDLEHRAWFNP
ncbi:MAG: D-Ala-D-Ala carboxypeptidase family metallohydrolase [Kofleriaceae bacterium]